MKVQAINWLNEAGLALSPHAMVIDHRHDGLRSHSSGAPGSTGSDLGRVIYRGNRAICRRVRGTTQARGGLDGRWRAGWSRAAHSRVKLNSGWCARRQRGRHR